MKTKIGLVISLIFGFKLYAAIIPVNGSVIAYAQVMFEFNPMVNAAQYQLIITEGDTRKPFFEQTGKHPAMLCKKLFNFGTKYFWQVKSINHAGATINKTEWYHFKTIKLKRANPAFMNVNVVRYDTSNCSKDLIIMDNNLIINREGKVVFGIDSSVTFVRDLTITPGGTLTYLDSTLFYETDRNGKVLWKSPAIKNDTIEINDYHHDMYKTSDNTYLCLAHIKYKKIKQQVKYSCIIEFDRNNNIRWFWSEKDVYPNDSNLFKASHANSIFYDEQEKMIYLSNRDLSSVMKINKQTRQIEYSFGYNFNNEIAFYENPFFKMQHRVIKLPNSNFLIFNNDSGDSPSEAHTRIIEITDPQIAGGEPQIVWEYPFSFDNEIENFIPRMGGAILTKYNTILVSTGVFDRVFEINRSGDIIWEARISQTEKGINAAIPVYRCNMTSSLFPYYFIAYKRQKSDSEIQLVNCGTEADEYIIYLNGIERERILLVPEESFVVKSGLNLSVKSRASGQINRFKP